MRAFLFSLVLLISARVMLYPGGQVMVLCYHTFLSKPSIYTDFSPREFEGHLAAITNMGYRFVSWDEIQSGTVSGRSNLLLTIDDANSSIREVDDIMDRYGIRPVVYIYPAIIGKVWWALRWDELRAYLKKGWSMGGHGYNHMFVNQKLFDQDNKQFMREVYLSRTSLERNLSNTVITYAYPFGVSAPVTVEHLKKAGWKYAFSLRNGALSVPLTMNNNPYDLPRYMVTRQAWPYIRQQLRLHIARKTVVTRR